MSSECKCGNTGNTQAKFVFACSGAADVGELADQSARNISRNGSIKMFCLAGIGGGVEGMIKTAADAAELLTIDGCPQSCARKTLEKAGITDFKHIELSTLGMKKGSTPATPQNIAQVVEASNTLLS